MFPSSLINQDVLVALVKEEAQKLFFEITSHEFETVIFLEKNRIYVRAIQKFFEEIHATLQQV